MWEDIEKLIAEAAEQAKTEIARTIEQNAEKWRKEEDLKKRLIAEHGELVGLIMYRQHLETV